ncbi:MAG: DHA2 family efflux MFS transporter permease subunit [Caulobacteraceae bacterium]
MPPAAEAKRHELGPAAAWVGFAAMSVGMFMAILDIQIVATALPTIGDALAIARQRISWIQTAYLVAEVIAIPLTGLLIRALGMRRLFVISIVVFTVASIGCAFSGGFASLIGWRIIQGFAGGVLIPTVFSAVFLLFPVERQGLATMIAGVLAVLAPTVGPIVGGWITSTYSWRWLFLINVTPGVVTAIVVTLFAPRAPLRWREGRSLDILALILLALALATLEIGLKEAPSRGWSSPLVLGLLALALASAAACGKRLWQARAPIVDLRTFLDRRFAIGCLLSFVLGIGLYGSVYMMPVFLGYVRGHDAVQIGIVMLVTGCCQLAAAPAAVVLEQRLDARWLTAFGFALFAIGLGLSAAATPQTDFAGMFWPQVLRGAAIMFCLLPPTRLALGHLADHHVPDASGLFNLMRNLGGAIGLALIDTVIYGRVHTHAAEIARRLAAGDVAMARFVGIPMDLFLNRPPGPPDDATREFLRPLVDKAAMTQSIDEAWALVALLTAAVLISVPFARSGRRES